jgi:hypothetical protein
MNSFSSGSTASPSRARSSVLRTIFELHLGLRVTPARHVHGDERRAAHQDRRDDHAERDVLECPHGADRAEALADDDHDEADRQGDERGDADVAQLTGGALWGRGSHLLTYLSVRPITSRWISFVPS